MEEREKLIRGGKKSSNGYGGVTNKQRRYATGSVDPKFFDLDTISNWLRRPADPSTMKGLVTSHMRLMPRKSRQGARLDLEITWPLEEKTRDASRRAIIDYLNGRPGVTAIVLHVGRGLSSIDLVEGDEIALPSLAQKLESVRISGSASQTLRLRPRFFIAQPDDNLEDLRNYDPAELRFRIVNMYIPQNLEWWHFELSARGKQWATLAEELGYARSALLQPEDVAAKSDSPWLPGWGVADKAWSPKEAPTPTNSPGSDR